MERAKGRNDVGGIPIQSQLGDFRHRCLATTSHRAAGSTAAMAGQPLSCRGDQDGCRDGDHEPMANEVSHAGTRIGRHAFAGEVAATP
jgi:hypothetical protein